MKDKFEIFNDMKIDECKYEDITLTKEEKDKMKEKMKSSVNKRKIKSKKHIAVASAGLIMLGGILFSSETTWAYIENIGRQIEMFLRRDSEEFKGYKVYVNQEVINEGIKINLKELMLDDDQMILSINLDSKNFDYTKLGESNNEDNTRISLNIPTIIVNDSIYSGNAGSVEELVNKDGTTDILIRASLDSIDTNNDGAPDKDYPLLENINPSEDYQVKIIFNDFIYEKSSTKYEGSVSKTITMGGFAKLESEGGEGVDSSLYESIDDDKSAVWEFNATINGAKIMKNIDVYTLNKEIEVEYKNMSGIVTIESVRVSPVSAKIKYTYKSNVSMYANDSNMPPSIDVFDENGNMIGGSGSGAGDEYSHTFIKEADLGGKEKGLVLKLYVHDDENIKYIDGGEIKIDLSK